MSPAAIASRWPQNRPRIKAVYSSHALLFSRWLTEVPATEAFDAQLIKKTSTSTESMFGLSPRKRRLQDDLEEDDLIGASLQSDRRSKADAPESPEPSNKSEQENYFSKAWAAQKNLNHRPWPTAAEQQHRRREEYSIFRSKPGSTADFPLSYDPRYRDHDRIWQYAADMPPFTQGISVPIEAFTLRFQDPRKKDVSSVA